MRRRNPWGRYGWGLGPLLLLVGISLLAPSSTRGGELIQPVLADTWIDGLNSGGPNGSDLALGICPVADYWIYLRFDVSDIPGNLASAQLRLTRFSGSRPEEICVYHIEDDSWSEATLAGVNRPTPTNPSDSAALAEGLASGEGYDIWESAALTDLVLAESQGDGVLTLMLRENNAPMFDVRLYRSKEASVPPEQKPQLVFTVVPAEVTDLNISGVMPSTLSWNGGGSTHDVATGSLAELRGDGNVSAATCLANDVATTSFQDSRRHPNSGDGYYYIVRGQTGSTSGTYGADSSSNERIPLVGCP